MAEKLLSGVMTIAEAMKRIDPQGNLAVIAEVIEEVNEVLVDLPMFEANEMFSDVSTVRTRDGSTRARRINAGAYSDISGVKQIREFITNLEAWILLDEILVEGSPNPARFRSNEVKNKIYTTLKEFSRQFIYGNPGVEETEIMGLAVRYNSIALENVHNVGGSGSDTCSMFILEYGESKLSGIYPRGAKSIGVTEEDKGKITKFDSSGNPYDVYANKILMRFGIRNQDDRAVQRLVNIEASGTSSNLTTDTGIGHMIDAYNANPVMGRSSIVLCNRVLKTQLDKYAINKSNVALTIEKLASGAPVTKFLGMPVRIVDEMLSTETALSA